MVLLLCETGNDDFFLKLVDAYGSKLIDKIKDEIMLIKNYYQQLISLQASEKENIYKVLKTFPISERENILKKLISLPASEREKILNKILAIPASEREKIYKELIALPSSEWENKSDKHIVLPSTEWDIISKNYNVNSWFPACKYFFEVKCKIKKCKEPNTTVLTKKQQESLFRVLSNCKNKINIEPLERTHFQKITDRLAREGLKIFTINDKGNHINFIETYKKKIKKFANDNNIKNCFYICAKGNSDYADFKKLGTDPSLVISRCSKLKEII